MNIPPKFIAEVSSNHSRDLNRCLEFIDAAAAIGCDAVKFQLFKVDQLFAPVILAKSETHRKRQEWELPLEFLPHLHERCREKNIEFSCTPFYLEAVAELLPYVDFYKIASYELLWDELLIKCVESGKPVILSTGMAILPEIAHAVAVMRKAGGKGLALLHCVSAYPTLAQDCNLAAIATIRDATGVPLGWSDHSVDPAVIYRAIYHWNAEFIEFHLDLDAQGAEYAAGHCWLPQQMAEVIATVKRGFSADGNGRKEPSPSELADRDWRADPKDGLRPMQKIRDEWQQR
jgi:N-acetylneuraminate synthase